MKPFKLSSSQFSIWEPLVVVAVVACVAAFVWPLSNYMIHKNKIKVVESQLTYVSKEAAAYLRANGYRRVTYERLLEEKIIEAPTPILGEEYNNLFFEDTGGRAAVQTADGTRVSVPY